MKIVISAFFNISGLIMAIYGLFFVIGKISTFDSVSEEVNKIEKDANAIVLKIENFKNEHATRFSRERSKNQILEEDKSDKERNFLKQNTSLEKMKVDIQEYEKTCEITLEKITEAKIDKVSKSKEFEKLNDDFLNANRIIPEIEVSKNNTQSKIEALEFEIKDLNLRKKNYENQTQILKMHHESVLDSLLADKNSRNWLEEGEQITVFLMSINLKNGILGILAGKEQGLYDNKLFLVLKDNVEICKIRILRSEIDKSIASIIPLFGEPKKLINLDEVILYHL